MGGFSVPAHGDPMGNFFGLDGVKVISRPALIPPSKEEQMNNRLFTLFCSTAMTVSAVFGQASESEIVQKSDSLMTDALSKGIFSGIVTISHNGKVIYRKQEGFADWNTKGEFNDSTLFNIGSLNKQFTEEMIHQLAKERKLSYDDPLSRYLPIYPAAIGDKITIRQLLDMTAGLGDFLRDPKYNEIRSQDFTLADVVNIIKQEPLLFEPGDGKEYSNSGFVVLGAVIEKITGMSYEENLKKRIEEPLGLTNFFYSKTEKAAQANRALGTEIDFEGNKKSGDDISNSTPAGGIYADNRNLLKFAEAKLKNALPSGEHYGRGMFAGGTPVWNSVIYYNEKNGYAFAIMANTGEIADHLGERLAAIINREPYQLLELPFTMTLYKIIREKGVEYVETNVQALSRMARVRYDDRFLNFSGYQFMAGGRNDIAIALFKINVHLFPQIPNTYDSLAEAYSSAGDKANAVKYYKLELQLDPDNSRAKKAIAELDGK